MNYRSFILILLIALVAIEATALDSLRMEVNNGDKFIIHRVDPKETLFAISKKYNVKIAELVKHNKGVENGLSIGQELSIPYFEDTPNAERESQGNEIIHVVKSGDTFYSISRNYNISIEELKKMNKLNSTAISLGDSLIVGYNEKAKSEDKKSVEKEVQETNSKPDDSAQYHTVSSSETLYSISKKYDISIEEIKKLNNLESVGVSVGQVLKIGTKAEKTEEIVDSKQKEEPIKKVSEKVTEESTKSENDKDESVKDEVVEEPVEIDTLYLKTDNSRFKERTEKVGNLEMTLEEGFAMQIHNTQDTRKYLALHREAPIGTVIEVKNQMNNLSIFARVVGKLPETGLNRNVLIRISNAAYEKLKALDARIPVEIGYVKDDE